MTFYPELKGAPLQAYRDMVNDMYARAMDELGLSRNELVMRPLKPTDLGPDISTVNNEWRFGFSGGNTAWSDIVPDRTIADNRFVGISGVYHAEAITAVSQVKIKRMGSDVRYWHVHPITQFVHKVGYADDPVIIDQNTTITISAWSRTASTTVDFGFIGAVVERKGLLITP